MTSSIELVDEKEQVIDDFMDWLYSHKALDELSAERQNLLFLFANHFDVPQLRKHFIDLAFSNYPYAGRCVWPKDSSLYESLEHIQSHISDMYEGITHGSSFRKIFVDSIVWREMDYGADLEGVHEWIRSQPDLATDLLLALCKKTKKQHPFRFGLAKDYYDTGIKEWVKTQAAAN